MITEEFVASKDYKLVVNIGLSVADAEFITKAKEEKISDLDIAIGICHRVVKSVNGNAVTLDEWKSDYPIQLLTAVAQKMDGNKTNFLEVVRSKAD